MIRVPLVPATLRLKDGIPYSDVFDDVYHPRSGAMAQARHVFLGGNDLPARWRGRESFTILETGFGLGQNFLATWLAWREDPDRSRRLNFVSFEKHPFRHGDLARVYARLPEAAALAQELLTAWPPLIPGFHHLLLDGGRVSLTLIFADALAALESLEGSADALFLDGFAPARNPDMWAPAVIAALARHAAPGATFATFTVAHGLRGSLAAAGFLLEKRPGFAGKREMLCGRLAADGPLRPEPPKKVTVVGAGIAGAALAYSLARRNIAVHLIDRQPGPAQETSGNPAGILMPVVSVDDNPGSRLTRAAFLYTRRLLEILPLAQESDWLDCGVLQLARDPDNAAWQARVAAGPYPPDYLQLVAAEEAARLAGVPLTSGGLYFPAGAVVHPPSLVTALLAAYPDLVSTCFNTPVTRIAEEGGVWRIDGAGGARVSRAEVLVLATARATTAFYGADHLPLQRYRGQLSFLPADTLPGPRVALCADGYLTPPFRGALSFGATYDRSEDLTLWPDSHRDNLARLAAILPDLAARLHPESLAGRAGIRATTPDRLPLAGALPDLARLDPRLPLARQPRIPNLYCLTGLASRGLAWAPLLAEQMAARLAGDPCPLERALHDTVDPARFQIRQMQKGR